MLTAFVLLKDVPTPATMTRERIVAFLWQKSFQKRATILGLTYIFYLVGNNVIIDTRFLTWL